MNSDVRECSLSALVDSLGEIHEAQFDLTTVDSLLKSVRLSAASVKPYTFFQDGVYTRNLVFKNDLFEVLLLCWDKGMQTPVHNHRGQLGWMMIQEGQLSVANYQRLACSGECDKVVRWSSMIIDQVIHAPQGTLCHVKEGEQVHQIRNETQFDQRAVSVHIYSKPIETCVIYDTRRNECTDRKLFNYSEYGRRLAG